MCDGTLCMDGQGYEGLFDVCEVFFLIQCRGAVFPPYICQVFLIGVQANQDMSSFVLRVSCEIRVKKAKKMVDCAQL